MKQLIKNHQDFEALMEEIDRNLQKQGIPIQNRDMRAMMEVSKKLGCDIIMTPTPSSSPIPEKYTSHTLSSHIFDWYKKRYKNRMLTDFRLGYTVLMIRGDPWLLGMPLIFGEATAICDRDIEKEYPDLIANWPGKPKQHLLINILQCIEDFTPSLASSLSDKELSEILQYFVFSQKFFNMVESYCKNEEIVKAGLRDLINSARNCVSNPADLGMARWNSLQAAEKFLKFYIEKNESKYTYTHDLSKLYSQASEFGLSHIDEEILDNVQCSADVRYKEPNQSIQDAVMTHQNALKICSHVIKTI
jgi:HEPN domain-containing protein